MNEKPARPRSRATQRARIEEVAEIAGVSAQTVSRYFREPHLLAGPTRNRVRKAVKEAGYVRNLIAGSLASNRTNIVGIIVPTIANPAHAAPVQGVSDAIRASGYHVLLGSTGYDGALEMKLIEAFLGRRLDAIAITGATHKPSVRKLLRLAGIPVVELWEMPKRPIDMAVGFSNQAGGAAIADHFFERGRRHFAVAAHGTVGDTRSAARLRGFCDKARAHGLKEPVVYEFKDLPSLLYGAEALDNITRQAPDTDAIFAVGDIVASGILLQCQKRGLKVPEQIAVAGFGDSEMSKMATPRLTTIRVPGYELGRIAGEMLLARLSGTPVTKMSVDVGFELIVRETT